MQSQNQNNLYLDHEKTNLAWPLYGAGLEKLGKNHAPVELAIPNPKDDEILVRVDSSGICASDLKVINLGSEHRLLRGRDLEKNPLVVGHETCVTVIKAGKKREKNYKPGERYLMIPGVFYHGKSIPIGYILDGGFQQYVICGKEILDGDEGSYLAPLNPEDGLAATSLSEPWACVDAAYNIEQRSQLKAGGTAWFIDSPVSLDRSFFDSTTYSIADAPDKVILSILNPELVQYLKSKFEPLGTKVITTSLEEVIAQPVGNTTTRFDDIILLGVNDASLISKLLGPDYLGQFGHLAILSDEKLSGDIEIDTARIHYDYLHIIGTSSADIQDAYANKRPLSLLPSGSAIIVGAGGPMGQMHVQRAAYDDNGPDLLVACDIDDKRLNTLEEYFGEYMARRGRRLVILNTSAFSNSELIKHLEQINQGNRYSDIVITSPISALVKQYSAILAPDGVMNIFAGIIKNPVIGVPQNDTVFTGQRWVGSCGVNYSQFLQTIRRVQKGLLDTNMSVAAIGGIDAVYQGYEATRDGRLSGKIVIYPQIKNLPLTDMQTMKEKFPEIASALRDGKFWTTAAEKILLEMVSSDSRKKEK